MTILEHHISLQRCSNSNTILPSIHGNVVVIRCGSEIISIFAAEINLKVKRIDNY